jgi:hypothetical protein
VLIDQNTTIKEVNNSHSEGSPYFGAACMNFYSPIFAPL